MRTEPDTAALLRIAPFALAALRGRRRPDDAVRRYLATLATDAVLDGLDAVLARDTGKIGVAYPLALVLVELGRWSAADAQYWLTACERSATLARDRSTIENVILAMYRRRALPATDPLVADELPFLKAQVMDRVLWYLAARHWLGAAPYDAGLTAILHAAALRAGDADMVAKLTCAGIVTPAAHAVLAGAAHAPATPLITLASLVSEQNAEHFMVSVA